jgi:hypothetical protein
MVTVNVDIYEGTDRVPVLTHTAYGADAAEALAVIETHAKYDAFLGAALRHWDAEGRYRGTFKGIPLRAVVRTE